MLQLRVDHNDRPTQANTEVFGPNSSVSDTAPHLGDQSSQPPDSFWPSYATPFQSLPESTVEHLGRRVSRMTDLQSRARALQLNPTRLSWSAEFQTRSESCATWMTILRSRWILLETMSSCLELWDLEGSSSTAIGSFSGLSGAIDGCVTLDTAGEPAKVYLSTS